MFDKTLVSYVHTMIYRKIKNIKYLKIVCGRFIYYTVQCTDYSNQKLNQENKKKKMNGHLPY